MLSRLIAFFTSKSSAESSSLRGKADAKSAAHIFAMRHHRFKLFCTAWTKFQELTTELEYTLCCEHPFGMYKVRALCTRVSTQVFQCIQQLNELSPQKNSILQERFSALQTEVSAMVYPAGDCLLGPEIMSLEVPDPAPTEVSMQQWRNHLTHLTDLATQKLVDLQQHMPDAVPPAFVITAAGCQHIMQYSNLQDEINRRIQAVGGLSPETLFDLSDTLGALVEKVLLPAHLTDDIITAVKRLRQRTSGKKMRLILRGRLWPEEQNSEHGLLLWGPSLPLDSPDTQILQAVRTTLARKYHAQGLVYRRYRGIPDTGASLCIVCMAVEEGSIGGLAHTGNPMQPTRGSVHIYSCAGLPEDMEHSRLQVDITHVGRRSPHAIRLRNLASPDAPSITDAQAIQITELALHLEKLYGQPQALTWLCAPDGSLQVLMCRALVVGQLLPAETLSHGDGDIPAPLASGGITASPGIACGPVHVVRTLEDARTFPHGGVLVVERDVYQWAALMDRAAAIVTEQGIIASRLGSLAREFGKPAVFGLPNAMAKLGVHERVTVYGDGGMIYPDCVESLLALAPPPRDFMPGSPVFRILQHAAEYILPLTLDPDSPDFTAANCHTYHDIARYCHEKAVGSMFAFGSQHKHAAERVKQLEDKGVLKQFWVVDLDDGFVPEQAPSAGPHAAQGSAPNSTRLSLSRNPTISMECINSLPMQALWQGMNAYPWQGPPPVDSKGFMSVLFEATANPHLDPAAQSAYFSEKNYFMISRDYCSLHSRFGFHFVSVEARLGARAQENSLVFQLRGGAANIQRRILRVRFVADILWECGFAPVIRNDAVIARVEGIDSEEGISMLQVAGYLTIHTRQLDMIMTDQTQVQHQRTLMLAQCRSLLLGTAPTESPNASSRP